MSMQNLKDNLDADLHKEAQAAQIRGMALEALKKEALLPDVAGVRGSLHRTAQEYRTPGGNDPVTALHYLSSVAEKHGVAPSRQEAIDYEAFWLKKLKVRDHEEVRGEKVREYARDRWAMDAIFADAGCPVRGRGAPTVGKAFSTSTVQVIFPFYYSALIQAGILASPILDRIIMEDIPVNSHTADHAEMADSTGDRSTFLSSEGAIANRVIIKALNRPVTLQKFQSAALGSYESLRLQRLPIFERGLMRVGQQFMIQITDKGMDIAIAGDGAGGGAAGTVAASASKNYSDVLALEGAFSMGYEMEDGVLIGDIAVILQLLNMAEFKDPFAGGRYAFHGEMPTPIGHPLLRWDATGNVSGWTTSRLMHIKPGLALIKYTEGGLLVETDRIINGQWELSVASTWTGFGVFDRAATKLSTGW